MLNTPSKRKGTLTGIYHDENNEEEPSLPSTPSQLGLEPPPSKPKGLLFQTPSRTPDHKAVSSPSRIGNHDRMNVRLGTRIPIHAATKPLEPSLLAQLESRLQILQRELTIETLETAWSSDNDRVQHGRKKHKLVSEDAREILKLRETVGYHHELIVADNKMQSQSIYHALAAFLPFSGKSKSTVQKAQPVLPASVLMVPLTASVQQSFLDRSNLKDVPILQEINVLDSQRRVLALLNFSVNPFSQKATNRIQHSHVELQGADELQSWLDRPGTERPLATVGTTIKQYFDMSSLRNQCWQLCREEFGPLVEDDDERDRLGRGMAVYPRPHFRLFPQSSMRLEFWWRISIQEDGDVRSEVSPTLKFPDSWARHDSNHDLSRIEEIFTGLLGEQGVTQAILTLTRILIAHGKQGASSNVD